MSDTRRGVESRSEYLAQSLKRKEVGIHTDVVW